MGLDAAQKIKEQNIATFKEKSAVYDNETTKLVARVVAQHILGLDFPENSAEEAKVQDCSEEVSDDTLDSSSTVGADEGVVTRLWDSENTRVLDFACGTGLLSQQLAPYAKQVVGADISEDMVALFNGKVYDQGIPEEEMQAYVVDVTEETDDKPLDAKFKGLDAIVSSLAYHHIYDIQSVTNKLASLLKKGGRLYVADIGCGSGSIHGDITDEEAQKGGVAHKGGVPTDLLVKSFDGAGLKNITVTNCVKVKVWVPEGMAQGFSGLTGETKEVNGRKLFRGRMNLVLVAGQML